MVKTNYLFLILAFSLACSTQKKQELDQEILASLGEKFKTEFSDMAKSFEVKIGQDSTSIEAYLGLADSYILLYVFGYMPRNVSVTKAKTAYKKVLKLDSVSSDVLKLSGILSFLDWQWEDSEVAFQKAIQKNPKNLNARHWYSLWLSAMGRSDEAMDQSDTISSMDIAGDYLVGRGSLLYFQNRFEEMKPLMMKTIEQNPEIPWGYDWLGMAYNGLGEHEDAINTYIKAFELSDGTVEVGAGLGHALGHAGETELAKQMAEYYALAAIDNYLPPVQRSFIHLGIGEYQEAINLLEQAYKEQSWFLIFIQIEPWYNPIRKDIRFIDIMNKMEFPD
ncbi:hypothetical protein ACFLU5_15735 [Bacteroidota bacterium]